MNSYHQQANAPHHHHHPDASSLSSSPRPAADEGWFDWAYKGVDNTLPGNGGIECRDFLSLSQRCWESAMASGIGLVALLYAYPRLRLPVAACGGSGGSSGGDPRGKRVLLILMCLTFGIELGFKFSTRQVIWIGNPCHLATMMQIFILAAPPSRIVTAAFRLHMHMLTGAPIAILFPVINTRLLPFETGVYFLQHILMLIIPFYLMKTGDPFIPEDLLDFKWAFTSFGFLYIYHFLPLQFLAYHSQVNLNNMLCPAVSDPFHGKYYRLFAICHQIILIPTLGKVFVILAKAFHILPCNDLPDAPIKEVFSSANCCCYPVGATTLDCPQEPPPPTSSLAASSTQCCRRIIRDPNSDCCPSVSCSRNEDSGAALCSCSLRANDSSYHFHLKKASSHAHPCEENEGCKDNPPGNSRPPSRTCGDDCCDDQDSGISASVILNSCSKSRVGGCGGGSCAPSVAPSHCGSLYDDHLQHRTASAATQQCKSAALMCGCSEAAIQPHTMPSSRCCATVDNNSIGGCGIRSTSLRPSRVSVCGPRCVESKGTCCPTAPPSCTVTAAVPAASVPSSCAAAALVTNPKSCGEGDSPSANVPTFVTRRLVNGKVTGCDTITRLGSCPSQQHQQQQQQQSCQQQQPCQAPPQSFNCSNSISTHRRRNSGDDSAARSRHRRDSSNSGAAADRHCGSDSGRPMSMSELDGGLNCHAKTH